MTQAPPLDHDDIEAIVRGFSNCTLPCTQWTHQAHLTVGLWHAREYPPDEALARVRDGIQRYNTACGTENSDTRGYHETITRFYMTVIGIYLAGLTEAGDWAAVTNDFVARCGDREFPLRYYTRDRLLSREARAAWIEPDLRPLSLD